MMNFKPLPILIIGTLWSIYSIVVGCASWQLATATIPTDQLPITRLVAPYTLPVILLIPFLFPRREIIIAASLVAAIPLYHLLRHEVVIGGTGWGIGALLTTLMLGGFSISRLQPGA